MVLTAFNRLDFFCAVHICLNKYGMIDFQGDSTTPLLIICVLLMQICAWCVCVGLMVGVVY